MKNTFLSNDDRDVLNGLVFCENGLEEVVEHLVKKCGLAAVQKALQAVVLQQLTQKEESHG